MPEPEDLTYVVVNDEDRFSVWPHSAELPAGWHTKGPARTRAACLAEIADIWTDLRPRSARESAGQAAAGSTVGYHSVVAATAAVVRDHPRRPAVTGSDGTLTFEELWIRSAAVAEEVSRCIDAPETPVGFLGDHGMGLPVAVLGILRSGAALVPLDPQWPSARIREVAEQAGVGTVVAPAAHAGLLRGIGLRHLRCDGGRSPGEQAPAGPVDTDAGPAATQLAYVVFTSGSTGRPKGVCVEHGALLNNCRGSADHYAVTADDRVLQFSELGVDIVLEELFTAWICGATVALMSPEVASNLTTFHAFLHTHQVSVLDLAVPFWLAWLEAIEDGDVPVPPASVHAVAVGSDEVPAQAVQRWLRAAPGSGFANAYGSTEQTITSMIYGPVHDGDPISAGSIGHPIPHVQAYALDDGLRQVPDGAVGQLHISGAAVARGYLGQPALTAERFVPDPHSTTPGARMYASRDAVVRLHDGTFRYVGRMDRRVMVRGYTVEPAELERIITAVPGVEAVTVGPAQDDDERLPAVVDTDETAPARRAAVLAAVIAELRSRLPEYMRPRVVLRGDPLAPAAPGPADADGRPSAAEDVITALWRDLLGDQQIRRTDNFFDLGGNSLRAIQLLTRLESRLGAKVALADFIDDATVAALAALAARAESTAPDEPSMLPKIEPRHLTIAAASYGQERLWFLRRLSPDGHAYHEPFTYLIEGPVSAPLLQDALRRLMERHTALRTAVRMHQGELVQEVVPVQEDFTTATATPGIPWEEAAHAWLEDLVRIPFAVEDGRNLRAGLLSRDDGHHLLCVVIHHIAVDAWSSRIVCHDLGELYSAAAEHRAPLLDPLPVTYIDFAVWQRDQERTAGGAQSRRFWQERTAGIVPAELPSDRTRGPVQDFAGATTRIDLDHRTHERLIGLARREGVTLFQLLAAVYTVFVARHTGAWDTVIGTPVANRHSGRLEGLVGFVVNTVPLRTDLSDNPRFSDALHRVADETVLAERHAHVPFEHIVEMAGHPPAVDRNPLFQTLFQLEEDGAPVPRLAGTQVSESRIDPGSATVDLSLTMRSKPGKMDAIWRYSTALFSPDDIARMAQRLATLIAAILDDPAGTVQDLPILPPEERTLVAERWALAPGERPALPVHELVREEAAGHPDRVAVTGYGQELTYRRLQESADALAAELTAADAGPYVPLLLDNGPELVIAMLAVLQIGSAFVPLDPQWPASRREGIISRLGATVAVTARGAGPVPGVGRTVEADPGARAPGNPPRPAVALDRPAYVMFTSGSTGVPKGAVVNHRGLVNHLEGLTRLLGAPAAAAVLQIARPGFDHVVRQCLWPLTTGGRTVIGPIAELADPARLAAHVVRHAVTTVNLVPSLFAELVNHLEQTEAPDSLRTVRAIIVGGEALRRDLAARFRALSLPARLFQSYGTTETAISSIMYEVRAADGERRLPIGRPMSNTGALVLDAQWRPQPVGVVGELWLTGDCVGAGYLGDSAATRRAFATNPFPDVDGERLYRTGDLARWTAAGELELLGRSDRRLKVSGVRVEPGEVEAAVLAHPGIEQAAVVLASVGDERGPALEPLRAAAHKALAGLDPHQARVLVRWAGSVSGAISTTSGITTGGARHEAGGQAGA